MFLQPVENISEVVINKDFDFKRALFDKNHYILKEADFLKEDILGYSKQLGDTTEEWPPTYDNLLEKIQIPESLELFLIPLLKNSKNNVPSKTETVIETLAAHIIFSVTRDKLLTLKHFALAMGLHSITGSRQVIDIFNKLGHCIDYNTTCEIETSQAGKAQKLANISSTLPLLPSVDNDTLDTYFWVDNFYHIAEKVAGSGAVNTTHLIMAFQEPNLNAEVNVTKISVTRTGKRTFEYDAATNRHN